MVDFDARNSGDHHEGADRPVSRFVSLDGERFLDVVVTAEGNFKFVEARLFNDDDHSFISPVSWSGLYSSAADAEREAKAVLEWLADARRLED
jgi:hypothetical protein